MLYLLTRKLKGNKQEGMKAILYTSRGNSKGYRELADQLIRADPPTIVVRIGSRSIEMEVLVSYKV